MTRFQYNRQKLWKSTNPVAQLLHYRLLKWNNETHHYAFAAVYTKEKLKKTYGYGQANYTVSLTRAPQAGQYTPVHQFWKKMIGIPYSPVKWRDNREKVDKILTAQISTYGLGEFGFDVTGWKPGF